MAWTVTDWNGVYGLGPGGNLRVGLFELCRALNQREDLIGIDQTEFYKGDGTEGTDLESTDFVGLPISAPSGHSVGANLQRLYDGLVTLLARTAYVDAADLDQYWTITDLQTYVGGALDEVPGLLPSAALLNRWQAAFDQLVVIVASPALIETRREGTQTSTTYGTADLAWAARNDEAMLSWQSFPLGYAVTFHNNTGPKYRARVTRRVEMVLNPTSLRPRYLAIPGPLVSGITGTILRADAIWVGGTSPPFSNTFDYSVNGFAYSNDGTTEIVAYSREIEVENLVDPFSVTLQASPEPSSNPFPEDLPWVELGRVEFEPSGARLFIDVGSSFTDQE